MHCSTKAPEGPGPLICVTLTTLLKLAEADAECNAQTTLEKELNLKTIL